MSLLNKIQAQLNLPDQQQPAAPRPSVDNVSSPSAVTQIVDIDQRDAFIGACIAVKDNAGAQAAIWQTMSAQGMNVATLNAAAKVICRYNDAELIKRYGSEGMQPVEMKTAKEWSEMSLFKSKNPDE